MTDKIFNIDYTTVCKIILHDATGLAPTFKYILLFPPLVSHSPQPLQHTRSFTKCLWVPQGLLKPTWNRKSSSYDPWKVYWLPEMRQSIWNRFRAQSSFSFHILSKIHHLFGLPTKRTWSQFLWQVIWAIPNEEVEKWDREMRKFQSWYIKEWVIVAGNWDSVELGNLWETMTHLEIVSPEDGVTEAFTYPLTPFPLICSELATGLKCPPKIRVLSRTSEGDLILN